MKRQNNPEWPADDVHFLRVAVEAGWTSAKIANEMARSTESIRAKRKALRLFAAPRVPVPPPVVSVPNARRRASLEHLSDLIVSFGGLDYRCPAHALAMARQEYEKRCELVIPEGAEPWLWSAVPATQSLGQSPMSWAVE
jgi:hypothetical protein